MHVMLCNISKRALIALDHWITHNHSTYHEDHKIHINVINIQTSNIDNSKILCIAQISIRISNYLNFMNKFLEKNTISRYICQHHIPFYHCPVVDMVYENHWIILLLQRVISLLFYSFNRPQSSLQNKNINKQRHLMNCKVRPG